MFKRPLQKQDQLLPGRSWSTVKQLKRLRHSRADSNHRQDYLCLAEVGAEMEDLCEVACAGEAGEAEHAGLWRGGL